MISFETTDPKKVRSFRIAQFNGRTATVRAAGSLVTGRVRPELPEGGHARAVIEDLVHAIRHPQTRADLQNELLNTAAEVRGIFERVIAAA